MGFALIGVILLVLGIYFTRNAKDTESAVSFFCIGIALFAICILLSFFGLGPKKMKEPVLTEEIELVSLNNSVNSTGSGGIYITISANNIYSYRYEIESRYKVKNSKAYTVDTIPVNYPVTELEVENCKKPVLQKMVSESKFNFWSFVKTYDTEYIIIVPKGTIVKEISLQ